MRKIGIAVVLLHLVVFLCACSEIADTPKHDPTIVEVTFTPQIEQPEQTTPMPTPTSLPVAPTSSLPAAPTSSPAPYPSASAGPIATVPVETELPYIPEEIPDFLEISNEVIEYSQGRSTISLPVANISAKTAKGSLIFDVYEGDGIMPKYSLATRIEERDEKFILPGETVTLIATADTDLRDCWIRVRLDLFDPMMLVN